MSPFLDAFLDKGRMRPLLEKIPIAICTEPLAGLLGAMTHAAMTATTPKTPRAMAICQWIPVTFHGISRSTLAVVCSVNR